MESYVVTQKWKKLIVLTSRPNSAFLPCGASILIVSREEGRNHAQLVLLLTTTDSEKVLQDEQAPQWILLSVLLLDKQQGSVMFGILVSNIRQIVRTT